MKKKKSEYLNISKMPLDNRIVVAAAGSGKTTMIVDEACDAVTCRSALVTYTRNSASEIRDKAYKKLGYIPKHVSISTWYAFLLRHFLRPYQNCLYAKRISRIWFVEGQSPIGPPSSDIKRYYFGRPGQIYSDKASKFACQVIEETRGLPLRRFEQIFDRLYIDESQDLRAYDLELIELLMKSSVHVTLVGDHRQATYSTNNAPKHIRYARAKIVDKFKEWEAAGLCRVDSECCSHRCTQAICDFADQFFPESPKTVSRNKTVTEHDGVFVVPYSQANAYIRNYCPQVLRYNKTVDVPGDSINFGASKGMEFERTLIFPHKKLERFLATGNLKHAGNDLGKIYVAITRARQSAAFVVPDSATRTLFPIVEAWRAECS